MNRHERLLNALHCKPVDRPPVWFMRQAGRYLPEYRELKTRYRFLDLCYTPEAAAEATLQPLRRFPSLDASIIFSDILLVPAAMGVTVDYPDGGPTLAPLIRSRADLDKLHAPEPGFFEFLKKAIAIVRHETDDAFPIYGFAGAPFTLAAYMVEGHTSRRGDIIRRFARENPTTYHALMTQLAIAVAQLLREQAEAGCAALQLFDTWAGTFSPDAYRRYVLPYTRAVFDALTDLPQPKVYFINGIGNLVEEAAATGATALGIDWRIPLSDVRRRAGDHIALQGNFDPMILHAPKDEIEAEVQRIHHELNGHGHIFNFGNGIHPEAPISGVEHFLAAVTRLSRDTTTP